MGLLEDGAGWLESQRRSLLTVPAVYCRRNGGRIGVNATLGRTVFRTENEYGAAVRTETRDFLIAAGELPEEPERGDVILHAGTRYEVLAPGAEPVWRWSGTGRILRRIHTKETGKGNELQTDYNPVSRE